MKNIFIVCCCILYSVVYSQEFSYFNDITKAEDLYLQKEYKNSGEYYDKAYLSMDRLMIQNSLYNAACAWSLAQNSDKAFFYLNHIVNNSMIQGWNDPVEFYTSLQKDTDFTPLKADKRWNAVVLKADQNQKIYVKNIKTPVAEKIKMMGQKDQKLRIKLDSIRKKNGPGSAYEKDLMKSIEKEDAVNMLTLTDIISKYGWLGPAEIGYKNNQYLFLVVQHADIETQKKYLPILKQAVKDKKALPKDLAYLEDRINIREKIPQIYGSQVYIDKEKKEYLLYPVQDINRIEYRRASVGLESLSSYLKNSFNIEWDINAYKSNICELEKKLFKK